MICLQNINNKNCSNRNCNALNKLKSVLSEDFLVSDLPEFRSFKSSVDNQRHSIFDSHWERSQDIKACVCYFSFVHQKIALSNL